MQEEFSLLWQQRNDERGRALGRMARKEGAFAFGPRPSFLPPVSARAGQFIKGLIQSSNNGLAPSPPATERRDQGGAERRAKNVDSKTVSFIFGPHEIVVLCLTFAISISFFKDT